MLLQARESTASFATVADITFRVRCLCFRVLAPAVSGEHEKEFRRDKWHQVEVTRVPGPLEG